MKPALCILALALGPAAHAAAPPAAPRPVRVALRAVAPPMHLLCFDPDAKRVVASYHAGLYVFDARTGAQLLVARLGEPAVRAEFLPGGRHLLVQSGRGLEVWDAADGKFVRRLSPQPRVRGGWFALDADRRRVFALSEERIDRLPPGGGKPLMEFPAPVRFAKQLACSADGRMLASDGLPPGGTGPGRGPLLWSGTTGELLQSFGGDRDRHLDHLSLGPDGRTLTCCVAEEMTAEEWESDPPIDCESPKDFQIYWSWVRHYEVASGKQVFGWRRRALSTQVAVSPCGRLLAWRWRDPAVRLVDLRTGRTVARWVPAPGDRGNLLHFTPDGRLATYSDGLVTWDVSGCLPPDAPRKHAEAALGRLWADLASEDAAKARSAVWDLAAAPSQAVPLVAARLRPVPPLDPAEVAALVAALDDEDVGRRETATAALEALSGAALPAVRRALAEEPSLEAKRRLQRVARANARPLRSLSQLRAVRAVEVLEHVGDEPSRRVLLRLSGGARGATETEEARAALARLTRRKP